MTQSDLEVKTPVTKLADVARLAGCSISTASRVLNGNARVGSDEKTRVLAAAKTLAYVPNQSARALRSSKSRLVGTIIPTLDHAIYATMVNAMQEKLTESGVSLIISTSSYDLDLEFKQTQLLISRGVESLVLVGTQHLPETLDLLRRADVPYVFTYTSNLGEGGASVGFDNVVAGARAARFLLDLGHRQLAMIAGRIQDNDRAKDRMDGFLNELEREGVDRSSVVVVEANYQVDEGRNAMQRIMSSNSPPTAVFCGSDILAAAAMKYCHTRGINVPRDVSVLGFDNLEIAQLLSPELSTIEVPARDIGILAAQHILSDAAKENTNVIREVSTHLIVRESTRSPRL